MKDDLNANGQLAQPLSHLEERLAGLLETLLAGDLAGAEATRRDKFHGLRLEAAGACPAVADWIDFASQKAPRPESRTWLDHAALCSNCLALLRRSQTILEGDTTPQETSEFAGLASASPQWRHRLAAELAQTPRLRRKSWWSRLFWTGVCAAAAFALIFAVVLFHRNNAPEQLLAEAYSQNRTFDLRVPGAAYAPLTSAPRIRGAVSYRSTAPLVTARAQIEWKLRTAPSDRHWLELKARAATLDERYDDAIAIFDKLLASGPPTQSLLLDSSLAWFLRGNIAGDPSDRARALDYLRRARDLAPGNPVILFNEAVVLENLGHGADAADTWCRYLHLERDPQWKAEGRRRLQSLEQKLTQAKVSKCHWQG